MASTAEAMTGKPIAEEYRYPASKADKKQPYINTFNTRSGNGGLILQPQQQY